MAYEAYSVEWNMPIVAFDRFSRYVSGGWGGSWVTSGGTSDNFSTDGSRGVITLPTGDAAPRAVLLPDAYTDFDIRVTIRSSQVATGGSLFGQVVGRWVDVNNHYRFSLTFKTNSQVDLGVIINNGGASTFLIAAFDAASYAANSDLHMHAQGRGPALSAKVWTGDRDAPPEGWTVSVTDATHASGQVGSRAVMAAGNTNTNPLILFDDLQVAVPERWVDVTPFMDTGGEGGNPFSITAGDTLEASADTGGFGLPLVNADQRFTPGNINSPYHPNIEPGSHVRVRETIADRVFERAFGYVQYPEIQAWTQSNEDSPRDQQITIPVVDRAAWLAQGRRFVSTLAEHIIYHGGPSLIGYWPMGETEGPDVNPAVGAPWTIAETKRYNGFAGAPTPGQASITYGSAGIASADDLSAIIFSPSTTLTPAPNYVTSLMLTGTRPTPLTLQAGQVLTVVAWTRPGDLLPVASTFSIVEVAIGDPAIGPYEFASVYTQGSTLIAQVSNPAWFGGVAGPPAPKDHSMPIAIRVGFDPPVLELWVRDEVYTNTLTVNTSTPWSFDDLNIGERYPGAVNHAQVYLGNASDWTHADFVAQYEMGLYGMERQSTGERIRTVLKYAGVDPGELGRIDDGASLMQVARLAGRNPMDLVADAVATEQGEFYAAGDNRLVFADRTRLYNI